MVKVDKLISFLILIIVSFGFLNSCSNAYSEKLPSIPEITDKTPELKNQILTAHQTALDDPSDVNLGKLGMVYYASNYYNRAIKTFDLAIERNPNKWEWSYYNGLLHMELGESTKALEYLKNVTQKKPDVWIAWYRLGEIYQQTGATNLAEETLKKITLLDDKETVIKHTLRSSFFPIQLYAKVLLGKTYLTAEENDKAEKELRDVTDKYKGFGPAFRQLGVLYAQNNKTELSKQYSDRANDLKVFNTPLDTLKDNLALISKSEAYVLKQIDDAMKGSDSKWSYELIQQARKNIPNNKYILSKTIRQYLSQGTGKLALPLLDSHFALFNDNHDEILQIGIMLADAGYRKESVKYFEKALSFETITAKQKATLAGLFYEKAGKIEAAIKIMSQVVESNPDDMNILGDATFLMIQTGAPDKAKSYYTKLKNTDPNNASVKIYEGIKFEKEGNVEKAITLFKEAYTANPKNKFIIKHVSELLIEKEKWREAESFYREALKTYPNDSYLQMYLGWVLASYPNNKNEDVAEGIEYSERAFFNSRYVINDRITAGRTLAVTHHQLGNQKLATYYIKQTIAIAIKAKVNSNYIKSLGNLAKQFEM